MSDPNTESVILVDSNLNNTPAPLGGVGLMSILVYGGVSVAVIIAIAYFSQIQLKSVAELFEVLIKFNKKQK